MSTLHGIPDYVQLGVGIIASSRFQIDELHKMTRSATSGIPQYMICDFNVPAGKLKTTTAYALYSTYFWFSLLSLTSYSQHSVCSRCRVRGCVRCTAPLLLLLPDRLVAALAVALSCCQLASQPNATICSGTVEH